MSRFLFALFCAYVACGCAGNKLTPSDESNLAKFQAEDAACIVAHEPSKSAIDACRAGAKALFEASEAALDGGAE